MWSVRVTIIALKTKQRVICIGKLNTIAMETQRCVSFVSHTYVHLLLSQTQILKRSLR